MAEPPDAKVTVRYLRGGSRCWLPCRIIERHPVTGDLQVEVEHRSPEGRMLGHRTRRILGEEVEYISDGWPDPPKS